VLRLIAGMIDTSFAGQIIDYLIEQNSEPEKFIKLFLAAQCLSEVRNRNALNKLDIRLLEYLKNLTKYRDGEFGLDTGIPDEVYKIRTQAVSAVATIWKDDLNTLHWLKSLVQSCNWDVQGASVQEVAENWKDHPETLPWLKTCAQSENDSPVRQTAVFALARGWKDDPDTLPLLKFLAQSDKNELRLIAVKELARGWKDDPETLPILKTRTLSDDDEYVRCVAVLELARGWKDEHGMFEFLCDRALNDPFERKEDWHTNPRQTALEAIIKQYINHPETVFLCKDRAENDLDHKVREFAVRELASGWKDKHGMFEFLCDRALNDPFERKEDREDNPRQLALEIIIKQYPDHPQTLPLLQDRAENDSDDKVREFANKKLAELV
jgi:hypothetical protein